MQEANDKTGAAGKRGALIGPPEAWLERGGREGVGEVHGVQEDDKHKQDEESEDEKRKQSEDER